VAFLRVGVPLGFAAVVAVGTPAGGPGPTLVFKDKPYSAAAPPPPQLTSTCTRAAARTATRRAIFIIAGERSDSEENRSEERGP